MEQTWYVAMIWIGLALLASVISMRTAISVALVEICVGVLGGNFLGLDPKAEWISFLAGFGAILLTFLAGLK
jgi:Kef-type K+ transport system membrane component KefB